jgi:hypothetical protein
MKSSRDERKRHKPGPKPMSDAPMVNKSVYLEERLWDWAADHPEGASALMRRLLQEEYDRQRQRKAVGS